MKYFFWALACVYCQDGNLFIFLDSSIVLRAHNFCAVKRTFSVYKFVRYSLWDGFGLVFLFLLGREKRLFGSKLLVFHFRRKGGREEGSSPWYRAGPGPPGCRSLLPAGGREGGSSCPPGPGTSQLYKILHELYFIDFFNISIDNRYIICKQLQ